MPDFPQGIATFPGAEAIESASYTRSHGITPSVCTLRLLPQRDFTARDGTLEFNFGNVRLVFPDCRVDQQSLQRDPSSGEVWALSIFDRRWKWAFAGSRGPLSGHYNWLGDDARPEKAYKRRPQELARLCLDAMGERGYDVSEMPNDFYPEVDWDNANPAQSLADLAEKCGCRVVLALDNTVRVCRTGFGRTLPLDDDVLSDSLTIDPPERPDALRVVCPQWYQCRFALEAVGLDIGYKIVPIDELSYKPAGGWERSNPPYFSDVEAGLAQDRAKETVYRWYRIRVDQNADGSKPFKLPGYPGKVEKLKQLLPDVWAQNNTWTDEKGEHHSLPAEVMGVWYAGDLGMQNTAKNTPYLKPFDFDPDEGIVKFERHVRRYVGDIANRRLTTADLFLNASVQVKDVKTWALQRYVKERVYPGPQAGTGARILHSERWGWTRAIYVVIDGEETNIVSGTTNNYEDLDQELSEQMDAVELEYQATLPQQITYDGLKPIDLDGAIQQVTWSVSITEGATTQASRNNEFSTEVPTYEQRRVRERLRADDVNELKIAADKARKVQDTRRANHLAAGGAFGQ